MQRILPFVLALLLPGLLSQPALCAPNTNSNPLSMRYTVTDLGTLPGCDSAVATGINDNGVVVGVALINGNFDRRAAFVWREGKILPLPPPEEGDSYAHAINNRGDIVGFGGRSETDWRPLLWQAGKKKPPVRLSEKPGQALALNAKGQVLVKDTDGLRLWPQRNPLIIPPPEGKFVRLSGLNDRGDIIGIFARSGAEFSPTVAEEPFLYHAGKLSLLGTLGGKRSVCTDINSAGDIIGWAEDPQRQRHACLWKEGALQELPMEGAIGAEASAINSVGVIVGRFSTHAAGMRACLWWSGQGVDLNTRIPAASGWTLHYASGINRRGQIIGSGFYNGSQRAFLLTPLKK